MGGGGGKMVGGVGVFGVGVRGGMGRLSVIHICVYVYIFIYIYMSYSCFCQRDT